MYSYLVDDNSEQEKGKEVNKNIIATASHYEYEFVLLNKKFLIYLVNSIQSKGQRIRTYEISNIFFLLLDVKG